VNEAGSSRDELAELRETWESFGRDDPLWAVLTDPTKRGGRWDVDDFFATGEREVEALLERLATIGVRPAGRALDFGCGVGRLSRALSMRFESVLGVDISDPMIVAARRLNQDRSNIEFATNPRVDLAPIADASITFVYSRLVFQHMPPQLSLAYVAEFGRVLARGGYAAFQIPRAQPQRPPVERAFRHAARRVRAVVDRRPRMGFFAVPPHAVREALGEAGLELVAELDDPEACDWPSFLYVARRT